MADPLNSVIDGVLRGHITLYRQLSLYSERGWEAFMPTHGWEQLQESERQLCALASNLTAEAWGSFTTLREYFLEEYDSDVMATIIWYSLEPGGQ